MKVMWTRCPRCNALIAHKELTPFLDYHWTPVLDDKGMPTGEHKPCVDSSKYSFTIHPETGEMLLTGVAGVQ